MTIVKTTDMVGIDGVKETIVFTKGTNYMNNLTSPYLELPTVDPTDNQATIVVTTEMFPTFSQPCDFLAIPYVYAYGKNTSTATASVSYRLTKNGAVQTSGSGNILAGNFFCVSILRNIGVATGDVFELKVWSSIAGTKLHGTQLAIAPGRVIPRRLIGLGIADVMVSINTVGIAPTNFGGEANFTSGWTGNWVMPYFGANGASLTVDYLLPVFPINSVYGIGTMQGGDILNPQQTVNTHATAYTYSGCRVPNSISYRRIL